MQPARIKPHAKEHTNNPVQRPHFRGQGATKLRDNEKEALKRFPTKGPSRNDTILKAVRDLASRVVYVCFCVSVSLTTLSCHGASCSLGWL
jgi:hypothetical protein